MTARYLWLGQVFTDEEISQSYAISAAASQWQKELLLALSHKKVHVDIVGHYNSSLFPKGKLLFRGKPPSNVGTFKQHRVGYLNSPFLRSMSISNNYKGLVNGLFASGKTYDGLVTYNNSDYLVSTARDMRSRYNLPWISLVADDHAPVDADGYIFLSHGYYDSFVTDQRKLHLDGGVSQLKYKRFESRNNSKVISAVYTGTLGPAGGTELLFRSASLFRKNNIKVSIYGKSSWELKDQIKNKFGLVAAEMLAGFVCQIELEDAISTCDVLLNPRPTSLQENRLNFPSKLLSYASYPIPTISSLTDGISPEWLDFLFILNEETPENLVEKILKVVSMSEDEYTEWNRKRLDFISNHTWGAQAERLSSFLAEFKNVGS